MLFQNICVSLHHRHTLYTDGAVKAQTWGAVLKAALFLCLFIKGKQDLPLQQ